MKKLFFSLIMMLLANVSAFADSNTFADLSSLDYAVYINDTQAKTGGQVTLSIYMKNATYVTLWQTDMVLPEGITPATDTSGKVMAKLSTARTTAAKHTLETNILSNGNVRLFCASQGLKNFAGFDGEVATITLNIDKDMEPGTYSVLLKNTLISQKDQTGFRPGTYTANITVVSADASLLGDINNDGTVSVLDLALLIDYLNGNTQSEFNESAADIDNSGAITKADALALASLLGAVPED